MADRYEKAVLSEIKSFPALLASEAVNSIYFGGGTPSLVPAEHIVAILEECRRHFRISQDCEISLESNPGTISADKAALFRQAGISRISVGAQSFEDRELSCIGRIHTADTILESLDLLRESGFININLDLMLGLPYQTAQSWRKNLDVAARLRVTHISVYMLDLDEQCRLYSMVADGSVEMPEEDVISDLYLETIDFLSSCGYAQYEISNFARPDYVCRHNLKYWTREPFYGFGLGSHSFDRHSRYANCAQMGDYVQAIETGISPVLWRESVTRSKALEETLFLGLRLTGGVDWNGLQTVYGDDPAKYEQSLQEWCARGLVERNGSVVRLTPSGMLLSNEIFEIFV
jgi:oxygen-independent coproporphyrinogen-3 oxidase